MAEEKVDLDDWDLDDELDLDLDFDPPAPKIPTDREAIVSAPVTAATTAAKKIAGDRNKRKRLILDSLPEDYTVASDAYDTVASEGREVYREAADQLKETKRDLKRITKQSMPLVKRYLPSRFSDKVDQWASDDDSMSGSYRNTEDPREAGLQAMLSDTFQASQEQREGDKEQQIEEKVQADIETAADAVRQDGMNKLVSGIRGDLANIVSYNRVTDKYRRKMLEVSWRQYYAQVDTLSALKESMDKIIPAMDSIVKNTALPDYAKEQFGEITTALMKREIIRNASPAEFARNYISNLGGNAKKAIAGLGDKVRSNLNMVEMGADSMMQEMEEEPDVEKTDAQQRGEYIQSAAGMAGDYLTDKYLAPMIKKYQKMLKEKGEEHPEVAKFGAKLRYRLTTLPEYLNDAATGRNSENPLLNLLTSILPRYGGDSAELSNTTVTELSEASAWTRRNDVTLNDVIPEWLSRIYSAIMEGNGKGPVNETFDYNTMSFVDKDEIDSRIRDYIEEPETKESVRQGIDSVINEIDTRGELTESQRESLGRTLDDHIRNVKQFNVKNLADNQDAYSNDANIDDIFELNNMFKDISDDKTQEAKINALVSDRLSGIRRRIGSAQEKVTDMQNQYSGAAVARAGVFDREGEYLRMNKDLLSSYDYLSPREKVERVIDSASGNTPAPDGPDTPTPDPNPPTGGPGPTGGGTHSPEYVTATLDKQTGEDITSIALDVYEMRNTLSLLGEEVVTGVRDTFFGDERRLESILENIGTNAGSENAEKEKERLTNAVLKQLEENNLRPEMQNIIGILEDMAINGVPSFESADLSDGDRKERAGYFGKFGEHVGKVYGRAKNFVGNTVRRIKSKIPTFESVKKFASDTIGQAKDVVKSGWKGLTDTANIYDADGNLVLSGRLMKLGKYYNKEGKPIKSIDDIDGAVYDEHGEMLLSTEDIANKIDGFTYYTKSGMKSLGQRLGKLSGRLARTVVTLPSRVLKSIKEGGSKLIKEIFPTESIYVKGEDEPRLKAFLIDRGHYIDVTSGKVIKGPGDIKGPVITKNKEWVIDYGEFDNPDFELVDANGEPFKSVFQKAKAVGSAAWEYGKRGLSSIKKGFTGMVDWTKSMLGKGVDSIADIAARFLDKLGITKKDSDIVDKLEEIRVLLSDQFGVGGNDATDGEETISEDGVSTDDKEEEVPEERADDVDGDGIRDNSYRDIRQKRAERAKEKAAEKERKRKARKDRIKEAAGNAKAKGGEVLSKIFGLGSGAIDKISGLLGGAIGSGILAKITGAFKADGMIGSLLSKLNPFGGNKAAANAANAASKTSFMSKMGTGLRTAGSFIARQGMWTAVRGAAVSALGVLSAPAWLAVGAAALGVGAYMYFTSDKLGPLARLRMAQYGTHEYDDPDDDEVEKLVKLESIMAKHTSYDSKGIATVKGIDDEKMTSIAKLFGVDTSDKEQVESFKVWLYRRYMQVYLLWATRAQQHAPEVSLGELDNIKKVQPKNMKKILEGCVLPADHPSFEVLTSPFELDDWFQGELMTGKEIKEEVEPKSRKEIEELVKEYKGEDTTATEETESDADKPTSSHPGANAPKPKRIGVDGKLKTGDDGKDGEVELVKGEPKTRKVRSASDLTALEAVRVRTYGLESLDVDKVQALWDLEEAVVKSTSFSGNGFRVQTKVSDVAKTHMANFGMSVKNTEQYNVWSSWFKNRFLPVFVEYLTQLKRYSPQANVLLVNVSSSTPWAIHVANGMVNKKILVRSEFVSVWSVRHSPWPDISQLNDDPSTVEDNLKFLRKLLKQAEAREQKATDTDESTNNIRNKPTKKPKRSPRPKGRTSLANDILDKYQGTNSANDNYTPDSNIPMGDISKEATDPDSAYGKIKLEGNDRASVAEMIKRVSQSTGVDESLLLTVAMMESSLNPKAGASTSSAKGLYQFINSTWNETLEKHGNKYGIPRDASPYDPVANALMGAEYLRSGAQSIKGSLPTGVKPGPADLYLAHFLGHGGASKFLSNLYGRPDAIAAEDFTQAAAANPAIFTDRGRPISYREVHEKLTRKASSKFSYVSQYTDAEPDFSPVVKDDDRTVAKINPEEDRSRVATQKLAKDLTNKSSVNKAMENKPTYSRSDMEASRNVDETVKKQVTAAATQSNVSLETYTREAQRQVDDKIKETERQLEGERASVASAHLEEGRVSNQYLSKQLEVLKEISLTLSHMKELQTNVPEDGVSREQLMREQQAERTQLAKNKYEVNHSKGPVSLSRKRRA